MGYDSGEIDGHVLTANISDVTSLIVNNKNIESLTGIEDFTALTLLWCFNNQITSLDLSANTALNTLYCYTNQLTSLDLSANPTLEYLTCYSNSLTTLDLSSNPNLEILNVGNNQLETLDLRNGNNSIISYFIATYNPNLSCIFVDNPSDSNDSWQIDPDTFLVADETACQALSVGDPAFELGLSVYPNPTSDIVYIDGNYTQLKVVVYDILGKQVMNKSITNSIDISHLGNGVYILQLSDGAKLTTKRIIKN